MTPHFTIDELTCSDKAKELGLSNTPSLTVEGRLRAVALCMEQVRAVLGERPIIITSGYRSPAVNAAVGGTPTSDHALGWAVDFFVKDLDLVSAAQAIVESRLVFDQLIYEPSRGVLHLSFNPRLRREVLTQKGGPGSAFEAGIAL